jgi:sialate O-acetylesterase
MVNKTTYQHIRLAAISSILSLSMLCMPAGWGQEKQMNLQLASLLQSNMVIQQNKPFTLWGKALPLTKVSISASWKADAQVRTDKEGKWKVKLSVPKAIQGDFTPHQLYIRSGSEKVVLSNLLIGDVWLCSGQSNMDMSMQPVSPWHLGVKDNEKEISAANFSGIRLFKVKKETSTVLLESVTGNWRECTPETVADFSGVAFYFGRSLLQKMNIPIGLLLSAYGSASCQAFIKKEVLESDSTLKNRYLLPYYKNPEEKIPVLRPMLIYNAMIYPLLPFSIRGFIWYQGESNAGEIKMYPHLNAAMIRNWREDFQQGDLPFYFVQMTSYNWKKTNPAENNYAKFREAQDLITQQVVNTGIVCTMDVGEPDNIHPVNKKPVGERLANLALNNSNDGSFQTSTGPRFHSMQTLGDQVIIYFKQSEGLYTSDQTMPRHFWVAGEDKQFFPAKALIAGSHIIVTSPNVVRPVAVRYAFTNDVVTNLLNKEGYPMFPFRTDQWNDEKINFQQANTF